MAYVSSTYKDPSDTFVWWVEGDRLAIATTQGDGSTTETNEGKLKAVQLGSTGDQMIAGLVISYYAEPDKLSAIDTTTKIDIDNVLQPALIDFVKGKALMDAAARATDGNLAQIRMASAQQCMANYKEAIRRYGMKKNDKTGGTRAVVPADMR
jgi:hypothetical protein|tara:strand:+ start:61 stop:519 length:459 start_codon:yes stop_codon:yes gene_type:complete